MESVLKLFNWGFWLLAFTLAVLNAVYVHPAVGIGLMTLSLVYVPPLSDRMKSAMGFEIPPIAKILLGIAIIWISMIPTEVIDKAGFN
jgi:hypothetical protein